MSDIKNNSSISKWESATTFDNDSESQILNNHIKFVDNVNVGDGDRSSVYQRSRRPSFNIRRLSASSIDAKIARNKVEPSIALPPIFKTVSYKIEDVNDSGSALTNKLDASTQQLKDLTWHLKTVDEVASSLSTDLNCGLSTSNYEANLKFFGHNVHSPPKTAWGKKLFMYFFGGFGGLLMTGGILCCISWKPLGEPAPQSANLALGVILFIVFILQAVFNFWQDFSSSRVMNSINNLMPEISNIKRNGVKISEDSKNLVPGDLVFISNGERVSADIRIVAIEGADFAFDRSILTGESKPIQAVINPDKPGSNYLESPVIGLQGTYCVSGSGYGIVVATGDNTVFGKIAKLSSEPKTGLSPLQKEIFRFVAIVVFIIVVLIVIICIVWGSYLKKKHPDWIPVPTLIVDLVSIMVAFIPEGLPIALTTCLIITAAAMKKRQILCKSLSVVETLGSVSTICSDKTGTLTQNKMFVTSYCVGDEVLYSSSDEKSEISTKQHELEIGESRMCLISKLCNSAVFNPTTQDKPVNQRLISGNATDQAILRFGETLKPDDSSHSEWVQKFEVSFNSKNKFMIRLFQSSTNGKFLFMIKGAPDVLIEHCSKIIRNKTGAEEELDEKTLANVQEVQRQWSTEGQRVVLLAHKEIDGKKFLDPTLTFQRASDLLIEESRNDLVLTGLVGITDPPKEDIPDTVSILRGAGIRMFMVTGDFELTAIAIAKICGIVSDGNVVQSVEDLDLNYPIADLQRIKLSDRAIIQGTLSVTGDKIEYLNDNQWEHLTSFEEIVFSRTTPEQKLRIVQELQKRKHIVGMTGDGVNDAPSLRQADIGIAMAEGSDIAKEASDLVLLESFSSMVVALQYGRLVFENLKKTIVYLLPAGTYAELWPVLLNVLFGMPQVLSSFCMIIICCLTDCGGAITLAYEAPEKNLLQKKPRSLTGNRLVNFNLLLHSYLTIGTYYAFVSYLMGFLYFKHEGIPFKILTLTYGTYPDGYDADRITEITKTVSSIYFVTLVTMQCCNLLAARTRYLSVFQQKPLFDKATQNPAMIAAIVFAIAVTFFFDYIPWFQQVLGTAHVPAQYYFIGLAFGLVVLIYDEMRKWYVRGHPESFLAKIAW